ncbi:hypothetical protein NMK34_03645 [Micromonospora sp. BRA006-A]|uniref:hypothetical protein n=1 Tax=Micromonospora sp. BRA006-A TaxID=2962860 RepID=UPI00296FF1B9|nr:hypothetical protein [Micromonospora sp. BRA006-A]MDW3845694.1 hypothetical protein [Micromonospora sp. BRA006-A]
MSTPSPAAHIAVLSDVRALAWVLSEGRMAFNVRQKRALASLDLGSPLFLYVTSRCFRGLPFGGKSGLIAEVGVTSPVIRLDKPIAFAGNSFGMGCSVEIRQLLPPSQMVNLGPLVPELDAFHGAWHLRLRAGFVPLNEHDYQVLDKRISREVTSLQGAVDAYMALAEQREERQLPVTRP